MKQTAILPVITRHYICKTELVSVELYVQKMTKTKPKLLCGCHKTKYACFETEAFATAIKDQVIIGTKCNSLTQQFIGISTTIDTWATCFNSYRNIFRPSKNTDPISKVVKCTVGSPLLT